MIHIKELIENLQSPHYSVRFKEIEKLYRSRDLEYIDSFYKEIKELDSGDLTIIYINILLCILNDKNDKSSPWSLIRLFNYLDHNRKDSFTKMIEEEIQNFFSSTMIYNDLKIFSLRKIWSTLTLKGLIFITDIIYENLFPGLTSELLSNFKYKNTELNIKTLKVFKIERNRRCIKYVKEFLGSSNKELIIEAIRTLGVTGNIFESKTLKQYTLHQDIQIAKEACESLRILNGNLSLRYFTRIFKTGSKELKLIIINQISKLSSKDSIHYLLMSYSLPEHKEISAEIYSSITSSIVKNKEQIIAKYITNLDEELFLKNYNFIYTFTSKDIEKTLHERLKTTKNKTLRLIILDALSNYSNQENINLLTSYFDGSDQDEALVAYKSMLRIILLKNENKVKAVQPKTKSTESVFHIIYSQYIYKISRVLSKKETNSLLSYFKEILYSNNIEVVSSAISTIQVLDNPQVIFILLEKLKVLQKDDLLISIIDKAIKNIFYKMPQHITQRGISYIPSNLYKDMDIHIIQIDLLKILLSTLAINNELTDLKKMIIEEQYNLKDKVSLILETITNENDAYLILQFISENLEIKPSKNAILNLKELFKSSSNKEEFLCLYLMRDKNENELNYLIGKMGDNARTESFKEKFATYLGDIL